MSLPVKNYSFISLLISIALTSIPSIIYSDDSESLFPIMAFHDKGLVYFGAHVALRPSHELYTNCIAPVMYNDEKCCIVDLTGTTTFHGNLRLSQNLMLPQSNGTVGALYLYDTASTTTDSFMHNYGAQSTFVGQNAGNFTQTGYNNTAFGTQTLNANTTGSANCAFGTLSLSVTSTGAGNSGFGCYSLQLNTTGYENTAIGDGSLMYNTWGNKNSALGESSLVSNSTGSKNTALGAYTLEKALSGDNNIALGYKAGSSYTNSENNNLIIGNDGIEGESNVVRIGNNTDHTSCFIAGIHGVTTGSSDAVTVFIDSTGQLGTINSSRRYKKDINDMDDTSTRLAQLHPVTFKYKNQPASAPFEYGLVAEEVAEVFPELVVYNKAGEPETVKYHVLPTLLLNEYQQQQKKLEAHDNDVTKIIEELTRLDKHDKQFDLYNKQLNEIIERLARLEKKNNQQQ